MKKLSQIELYLDGSYTKQEGIDFMLGSRCLCGYLEQKLAGLEFLTESSRINIYCTKKHDGISCDELKGTPALGVTIEYHLSNFFTSKQNGKHDIYAQIVTAGLRVAQRYMPVPIDFLNNSISQFKSGDYKYKWIHLIKEWKTLKIKCVFECEVTINAFYQTQEIYVNGDLVIKELISKTKPREFLYFQNLGQATLKNGNEIYYTNQDSILSIYNIENKQITHPAGSVIH